MIVILNNIHHHHFTYYNLLKYKPIKLSRELYILYSDGVGSRTWFVFILVRITCSMQETFSSQEPVNYLQNNAWVQT